MPVYEYRCRECGTRRECTRSDDVRPCRCGGLSKRDYSSVRMGGPGLVPHYNHSVGQFVSSDREFSDALKRRAEDNTIQTGTEHNYVRVDPGDVPRPDAAHEAYEHRARTLHNLGQADAV